MAIVNEAAGQCLSAGKTPASTGTNDEVERAQIALCGILGDVTVVEEGDEVYCDPTVRLAAGGNSGAENAAPDLYLEPIKLK